ncbi:MAG: FtsW/RodA/SpoVE family cell cycle protein [Oscillospiraceae bacterium]|jgi:cell division protein FtsW (lipid II flippase)|nr:FtsW/RodA/SpoVE family cell cycle protein [Oscillospiraceae bacterium]
MADRDKGGDIKVGKQKKSPQAAVKKTAVAADSAKTKGSYAKVKKSTASKARPAPKAPARVNTEFMGGTGPNSVGIKSRKRVRLPVKRFMWLLMLIIISAYELFSAVIIVSDNERYRADISLAFIIFLAAQWGYYFVFCVMFKRRMELEIIGFLFSSISLTITASVHPDLIMTQFYALMMGLGIYIFMIYFLENANRVSAMRLPVALGAVGLLALPLVLRTNVNGAYNWLFIGGFSIQPSELVKIAFVFVGAATLDKLQSTQSLTTYLVFAGACVGLLFLQRDFGTALIFFVTFLILAFMRSGDIRTIILVCVAAFFGAMLIVWFKPHVTSRFESYRHIWELMDGKGYQQTRTLIYALSGGLFGVGVGNGRLRGVFASTEDLVFGVVCEELGILTAVLIMLTFLFLAVYTVRNASFARSTFYSIAACAAAGLLLFQTGLNVFGVTDLLPFTGVTMPFISRGGSSMMASWGLLAFIKASDIRTYPRVMKELLQQRAQ